jgi:hypothetical protein
VNCGSGEGVFFTGSYLLILTFRRLKLKQKIRKIEANDDDDGDDNSVACFFGHFAWMSTLHPVMHILLRISLPNFFYVVYSNGCT